MLAARLFKPLRLAHATRTPLAASIGRFVPRSLILQNGLPSSFPSRLGRTAQSRAFGTARWSRQGQNPFYRGDNSGGYQRFNNARGPPIVTLFKRWAARPTFYYEAGGLAGGVGGVYMYNLEEVPVSGRRRFNIVSNDYEQSMGREVYKQTMQEYSDRILPEGDTRVRLVKKVLERLIPASGLAAADWEVHVIDSDETNAFVIPGGKVFVFTGILPICNGEDGVAAVLGHEIAHNLAHHSAEKMSQAGIFALGFLFLEYLVGLPDFASQLLLTVGFERPGSRTQESEADYIGLMMMAQSCYNPEAAVDLWGRMQEAEKNHPAPPQLLSTHPSSANRQVKLREWLPKAKEKYDASECGMVSGYVQDFRSRAQQPFT